MPTESLDDVDTESLDDVVVDVTVDDPTSDSPFGGPGGTASAALANSKLIMAMKYFISLLQLLTSLTPAG